MSELRWDPLLAEWVVIAPHRMKRPLQKGEAGCPFCPSSGNPEVQGDWAVLAVPNKYGSLGGDLPGTGATPPGSLHAVEPAGGGTEVVLYARAHEGGLSDLPLDHLKRLYDLWAERETALGAREDVEYVFAFENRGAAVGVSQKHPHGQIYALPFVPATVSRMLERARHHREHEDACLHCTIVADERASGARVIAENAHAVAFVPYAARLPFDVRVYPRRHVARIRDLTDDERRAMAALVGGVVRAYRHVYASVDDPPYILAHYPAPATGAHPEHHYHVAFYPFQRSATALKYLGGVEFAGGSFVNDSQPEARAAELREALEETGLPE